MNPLRGIRLAPLHQLPLGLPALLLGLLLVAGCGNKIGDSCSQGLDCSPEGDRICDVHSPGGYCTVEGCDHGTCPDEATCVSFFLATTQPCATIDDCDPDYVCTRGGVCAPRSTERRYCMLTCSGHGDCRDSYECRDAERMGLHGGEPVPPPGEGPAATPQAFCAAAKPCVTHDDCDLGDMCDVRARTCIAG